MWKDIYYMIYTICGMVWNDVIYDMIHDMIWYDMIHDKIYDMTWYVLTAIGLTPSGSSTVHIYTQTIHSTTQWNTMPRTEHT